MLRRFFIAALILFVIPGVNAQQTGLLSVPALQPSEINIPIKINLKPIYALAERQVDTVFTSPGYPEGWVQPDCATRYKYKFRRSPLRMNMTGTTLSLGFTGYYQITGSTRGCVNGAVLTPWTPSCACGVDEPERRVNIGFSASFGITPDHMLLTSIKRLAPQPLDKCAVCFWGQDITNQVLDGLKSELDASQKAMTDSFGRYNLRPWLQQAWDMMNTAYALPGVGYLYLHPQKLRMQNIQAVNNILNLNLGLTATPVVSFIKQGDVKQAVPRLDQEKRPDGFNINLEAGLEYDSLSAVLAGYLRDTTFEFSDGLFKRHITVTDTRISPASDGLLNIAADFKGSFNGTVIFHGKPVYHVENRSIEVEQLTYELQTKNLLLKTAKWLFNDKIVDIIGKYTRFELGDYFDQARSGLSAWLNREWMPGMKSNGAIQQLGLSQIIVTPEKLLIRSLCSGKINLEVSTLPIMTK